MGHIRNIAKNSSPSWFTYEQSRFEGNHHELSNISSSIFSSDTSVYLSKDLQTSLNIKMLINCYVSSEGLDLEGSVMS